MRAPCPVAGALRRVGASEVGETGQGRSEPLIAALAAATLEEDYWIANVKPDRPSSPLVLPERVFNAKGELMEMWRLSESFNNQGHLQEASNRIGRFAKEHRRKVDGFVKTPWMDAKSWIWDDSGERHGKPDFPEDWKYSFRLPDGFLFDVSRQKDAKAAFKDVYGYTHPLPKGYLNVTAHGKVRGARPASSISA